MTINELSALVATLVTDFIRPNTQQHLESMQWLEHTKSLSKRDTDFIDEIDLKLDRIANQQETNAQQTVQNTGKIRCFDSRLEETQQLVTKNASDIAQMGTRHDQMSDRLDARLERINDKQGANAN